MFSQTVQKKKEQIVFKVLLQNTITDHGIWDKPPTITSNRSLT